MSKLTKGELAIIEDITPEWYRGGALYNHLIAILGEEGEYIRGTILEMYHDNMDIFTKGIQNVTNIKSKDSFFKYRQYISACMYVCYHNMGMSKREAMDKAFRGMEEHKPKNAAVYDRNPLVVAIKTRYLAPVYVMYAPLVTKTLSRLSKIIEESKSEASIIDASKVILGYVKAPEEMRILNKQVDGEAKVAEAKISIIDELRSAIGGMSKDTLKHIKNSDNTIIDVDALTIKKEED